jgi:MoxR-like ATPase
MNSKISNHSLREEMLSKCSYICSDEEAFTISMALNLRKPLLIEGPPGSGKTEVAKVLSLLMESDLIRLQCYEGLDEGKALYDGTTRNRSSTFKGTETDVFWLSLSAAPPSPAGDTAEKPPVLLIDE